MTEIAVPVPIVITGDERPKPTRDQTVGDGFTLAIAAGDPQGAGARLLLPVDMTRKAAWIQTDTICFIGTKQQMASIGGTINNASPGPGTRILNVSPFFPVRGTNEIWVAFTAVPTVIGVWVEREIPGSVR